MWRRLSLLQPPSPKKESPNKSQKVSDIAKERYQAHGTMGLMTSILYVVPSFSCIPGFLKLLFSTLPLHCVSQYSSAQRKQECIERGIYATFYMIEYCIWSNSNAVVGQICRAAFVGDVELPESIALVPELFGPLNDVRHNVKVLFKATECQRIVRAIVQNLSCHRNPDPDVFWSGSALLQWREDVRALKQRGVAFRVCNPASSAFRTLLGSGILCESASAAHIHAARMAPSATVVGRDVGATLEQYQAGMRLFYYVCLEGVGYRCLLNEGQAAQGILFGYSCGRPIGKAKLEMSLFCGLGGH
jgi:hypothetical protein